MMFIENALRIVVSSYAVWVGQIAGWINTYLIWLNAQTPSDQITLHAAPQVHWLPVLVSFLTVVGIPLARGIKQNFFSDPK